VSAPNFVNIAIAYNNFSGPLPDVLYKCPRMVSFFADFNRFEGPLPSRLPYSISQFSVPHNKFNGTLPATSWVESGPNIYFISVGFNDLEGTLPIEWANYSTLSVLSVMNNPRLGGQLPSEWSRLGMVMINIFIADCSFVGEVPRSWKNFTFLTVFYAKGTTKRSHLGRRISLVSLEEGMVFSFTATSLQDATVFCLHLHQSNFLHRFSIVSRILLRFQRWREMISIGATTVTTARTTLETMSHTFKLSICRVSSSPSQPTTRRWMSTVTNNWNQSTFSEAAQLLSRRLF
jgi:hypothetical protein